MRLTLREIYAQGRRDGQAAAASGSYCDDTAKRHARAYMRFACEEWGLMPRWGVRVLCAYHAGYTDAARAALPRSGPWHAHAIGGVG